MVCCEVEMLVVLIVLFSKTKDFEIVVVVFVYMVDIRYCIEMIVVVVIVDDVLDEESELEGWAHASLILSSRLHQSQQTFSVPIPKTDKRREDRSRGELPRCFSNILGIHSVSARLFQATGRSHRRKVFLEYGMSRQQAPY